MLDFSNPQELSGALLIDKPISMSSASVGFAIRGHLKKLLGCKLRGSLKVGHAGTLDPFATGVQILGIGSATKDLHKLEQDRKTYLAKVSLGAQTTTDDLTGTPIFRGKTSAHPSPPEIRAALLSFLGASEQMPCQVSAKRIDGRRAYDIARSGETATLKPVPINVYSLEIRAIRQTGGDLPETEVDFEIEVSKGTFIRAIARDLGAKLGCGGHLSALRRLKIGDEWGIDRCLTLENALKTQTAAEFSDLLVKYPAGTAIVLGRFDGVHLGHQKLLKTARKMAARAGQKTLALLVDAPSDAPLTSLAKRKNYLANFADEVRVLDLATCQNTDYTDFLRSLRDDFNLQNFVTTASARFGKNRLGTPELAADFLKSSAKVTIVPEVLLAGSELFEESGVNLAAESSAQPSAQEVAVSAKISSSKIRELIAAGQVESAKLLLGKSYKLSGLVEKGLQRGRLLGFPTANLAAPQAVIPGDGVYVGSLTWRRERYPAMISIGTNPTFQADLGQNSGKKCAELGQNSRSIEAHVPGESLDLYGEEITLAFEARLRDTIKFSSPEELVSQLKYDAQITKAAWALERGELIAIPSDTVLAIAFRPDSPEAKARLVELKRRDPGKKIQLLARSVSQARRLAQFTPEAESLAEKFWPGALTLVLPAIDKSITETAGLRVPAPSPLADLLKVYSPLSASSANISGEREFSSPEEARAAFGRQIGFYWDSSVCPVEQSDKTELGSTVIDLTNPGNAQILREGPLGSEVREFCGIL